MTNKQKKYLFHKTLPYWLDQKNFFFHNFIIQFYYLKFTRIYSKNLLTQLYKTITIFSLRTHNGFCFLVYCKEILTKPQKRKYTRRSKNSEINDNPSKRTRSKKSNNQDESNESFDNIKQQTSGRKKIGTIKGLATEYLENESETNEI